MFRNPNGAKGRESQHLICKLLHIPFFFGFQVRTPTVNYLESPARDPLFFLPQRINAGLLPRERGPWRVTVS